MIVHWIGITSPCARTSSHTHTSHAGNQYKLSVQKINGITFHVRVTEHRRIGTNCSYVHPPNKKPKPNSKQGRKNGFQLLLFRWETKAKTKWFQMKHVNLWKKMFIGCDHFSKKLCAIRSTNIRSYHFKLIIISQWSDLNKLNWNERRTVKKK